MTNKKERIKGGQNQNDRPSNAENECSCSCALDKQVINTELYVCICMDECLIGSDEVEGCAVGSGQGIQGETGELSSIIHGLFQFASSEAGPGQGA